MSATNHRAVLAADPELGAGNVLLGLAGHGADMDMPRVTFDTDTDTDADTIAAWTAGRDLPAGWRPGVFTGTEDECLAYIDETWTDMRPASLRRWMRDHQQAGAD